MTSSPESAAKTKGVHHVGLTVPDVQETARFFERVLGFERVRETPYPAVFVSDGVTMLTLWQAVDPAGAVPFDRKSVIGLHHLALKVDPETLEALYESVLADGGAEIEFAPEPLRGGPVRHMMCAIPGGVRLELIGVA